MMSESHESYEYKPKELHPAVSLILILVTVLLGFVLVGPLIGVLAALPFYPGDFLSMIDALQQPSEHPELKLPLYIMQGFATGVGLIVAPALLLFVQRKSWKQLFKGRKLEITPVVITVFTVLVFVVVNSIFIEWNSSFQFPDPLKGFEQWAREKEDAAAELTEFLTRFDTTGYMILALLVIAILPAIGEEFVFRGLIQNEFYRATNNAHLSIWIAAILFSAIHMQFFGFIPRLLLGALFGYLYYWSGNLAIPMIAHFVNNGFSVIALYMYQQGSLEYDVESTESAPVSFVLVCAGITIALLFYFRKYYQSQQANL